MIEKMIREARSQRASDIHISEGQAVYLRIDGKLIKSDLELSDEMTRNLILSLLTKERQESIWRGEDADFALETSDGNRQRVNVFCQQGRLAAAIRLLNAKVPTLSQLHLPPVLQNLANEPRGLILVTGPTGSGKSTTLAAMVDYINHTRADHILTIEDPIEYVYEQDQAVIHQREVGKDVCSFAGALRSALREDPDVILVGEMRDYETISAAVTAAETGHLVLSTLHTTGAAKTVDRIICVSCSGTKPDSYSAGRRIKRCCDAVPGSAYRRRPNSGNGSSNRNRCSAKSDTRRKNTSAWKRNAVRCGSRYAYA